jgi:hypothetical protein
VAPSFSDLFTTAASAPSVPLSVSPQGAEKRKEMQDTKECKSIELTGGQSDMTAPSSAKHYLQLPMDE